MPLVIARLLPQFVERHPKVEVEICVDDHFVDIVAGGYDAGIRLVEAIDRDMIHVRLMGECRLVVAGAPSYLKRRGVPLTPEDLLQHECICMRWTKGAEPWAWELERGKRNWRVPVSGPVTTNDSGLMRTLGVAGVGLIYTLEPLVADEIARGRLRVLLEGYLPSVPGLFLYFPSRAQISPAFRAFVDLARVTMGATETSSKRQAKP